MQLEVINQKAISSPTNFIKESEISFDKKLEEISLNMSGNRKMILLAGPSSSGKTTTAKKLSQIFKKNSKNTLVISLDDFYKNREEIPKDHKGEQDFETIDALDLDFLKTALNNIINLKPANVPIFDFTKGARSTSFTTVLPDKDDIIIVEGLHALNPKITSLVPEESIYKLYISVETGIKNNSKTLFTGRQIRFIRRMLRDFRTRSANVDLTFNMWKSVRVGEDKYLCPFKDTADEHINSFHPYEICIYKNRAEQMLNEYKNTNKNYNSVRTLLFGLNLCEYIDEGLVPGDSLLKEFIG